jgi:hypothetical protein
MRGLLGPGSLWGARPAPPLPRHVANRRTVQRRCRHRRFIYTYERVEYLYHDDRLNSLPETKAFVDSLPRKQVQSQAAANNRHAQHAHRLLKQVDGRIEDHVAAATELKTLAAQLGAMDREIEEAGRLASTSTRPITFIIKLNYWVILGWDKMADTIFH